ncbi:ABC transporter permease [Candidatus Saccharibacteria bacterium]|nr:ABC transporter permease [Candidatus Saccharibacteria bacterium]
MNKPILKVTKFEIIRQLKKPSFWVAVLAMPVLIGIGLIISVVASAPQEATTISDDTKIAITDEAGIIPKDNPFALYATKDEGIEAVKENQVDLYYYIPADFTETKKVEAYRIQNGLGLFDQQTEALKGILAGYVEKEVTDLETLALTGGYAIEDIKFTSDGEISNAMGKAIVPAVFVIAFFIFVCVFGNRMLMTVVEEKENRVSEMILTAVSSKHLIIGKILALLALGMIQILALFVPLVIFMIANSGNEMMSAIMSMIVIDPVTLIICVALFIFSILLFAGFCTYIGAITPTAKDAAQFIGPIIIGVVLPLYFMQLMLSGEVNGLVEFLTYFPFSAPIALMGRVAVGSISTTGLIIGIVELAVLSVVVVRATVVSFQKNAINFSVALPKFLKKG